MPKHTPEQVRYIANSLMPSFIPKDETISDLSFAFTADGLNYEVVYQKDKRGQWQLVSQQKV